jgi:hypothetical protein
MANGTGKSGLASHPCCAWKTSRMRASTAAILGVICFLIAGFVRGMGVTNSSDPELSLAAFYALSACGAVGVLAGGVGLGIRLSRD